MTEYKDQLGNFISLTSEPKRIISLVPSQTELLSDLGLDEEIIGITKYCVHPKSWRESKTIIGGTKKLNIEKIKELKPDLIIANKEENEKKQVKELMQLFPVWVSDIKTVEEALNMIEEIGRITAKEKRALEIQNNIREQFSLFKLATASDIHHPISVLYLIWKNPFISAGTDTFIHHLLAICGLENIIAEKRYPELSPEKIKALNPSFIFLSSEPYPFRKKHKAELQAMCPSAKIVLVDGEMFSWYGSRLLYAPSYFEGLILSLSQGDGKKPNLQ